MISLEEFKKALGEKATLLSEEKILELRELQDKIADAIFDTLLIKRNNVANNFNE